jgi:SET domain-containing protein
MPVLRTLAPAASATSPASPNQGLQPSVGGAAALPDAPKRPRGQPADPQKHPVRVGLSAIEGQGAFAMANIPARAKIGEIRGEFVDNTTAHARARQAQLESGHVFMVAVSSKRSVDATDSTDPLRFANHHCEPNMVLKVQQGRVAFYALRDIAEGEELTARYGTTHHAGKLACRCGAVRCEGWL